MSFIPAFELPFMTTAISVCSHFPLLHCLFSTILLELKQYVHSCSTPSASSILLSGAFCFACEPGWRHDSTHFESMPDLFSRGAYPHLVLQFIAVHRPFLALFIIIMTEHRVTSMSHTPDDGAVLDLSLPSSISVWYGGIQRPCLFCVFLMHLFFYFLSCSVTVGHLAYLSVAQTAVLQKASA